MHYNLKGNTMKRDVKYIRVSTAEQHTENQGTAEFTDVCSGSIPLSDRKQGSKLLEAVERGEIASIEVFSIDRLGRNTLDILQTVQHLTDKGVNVISRKEGLQTLIDGKQNPTAKLVLGIMASLAAFERERMLERQKEGIERAKAAGSYSANGGKPKESPEQFLNKDVNQRILKRLKKGKSLNEARLLGDKTVSKTTVVKVKKIAEELDLL